MKRMLMSQKKTLLFIFLSLGIMTSYQNCSGPKSGASSDSSDGASNQQLASQDPLKPAAAIQKTQLLNDATITGRLYTLESLQIGSQTLHATSGNFTLQFSSDSSVLENDGSDPAPLMKNVTFAALNACASKISGSGQMARFNGLPLPVGSISLQTTSVVSNTGCTLSLSADDASLQQQDSLNSLLNNARTMVLVDDKVYLQTADGETGVFAATNSVGIVTDDLGVLLQNIQGSWNLHKFGGNFCSDRPGHEICTQVYSEWNMSPVFPVTIDLQGHVTLQTQCGVFTGQLRARTQPIAGIDGLQLQMAFPKTAAVACSASDLQQITSLLNVVQDVMSISKNGSGMEWKSTGGNTLDFASE